MSGINIVGTGGIIEGTTNDVDVNVNLNSSLQFDGNDDKIEVSATPRALVGNSNDFTVSVWIYPTAVSGYIIGGMEASSERLYLRLDNREIKHAYGSTITDTGYSVTLNAWTHIAIQYDVSETELKTFVNGVRVDTASSVSGTDITNTDNLYVGALNFNGTPNNYFTGEIADLKIYNTEVSDADIKILASKIGQDPASTSAGTTNLKLWYKLGGTEASGSGNVPDDSPQSNTGTLTGTSKIYDQFYVDLQDDNTGGSGTFKVTQGKVEGLALSSVDFSGDTQLISCTSNTFFNGKTAFSVSAWFYHDNSHDGHLLHTIVNARNGGNNGMALSLDSTNDRIRLRIGDGSSDDLYTAGGSTENDKWFHVVATRDASNNTAIYINGELSVTGSSSKTISLSSGNFGIGGRPSATDADEFSGKIRDVGCWSYALSADQVAALCGGQYNVTPNHQYKLDEGYATAAENNAAGAFKDTGTETAADGQGIGLVDASCVNGTFELDGTLTLGESNDSSVEATISAPRGIFHLTADLQSFGAITHNDGTFKLDNGSSMHVYNALGGSNQRELTFYNVTMEGTGGDGYRISAPITIEKDWIINNTRTSVSNNAGGGHNSGVVVTLGTTTSAGSVTINSGKELETYTYANSHSVTYQGVSPLYPALFTNNGTFEETLGSLLETVPEVKFSNLKFALPFATRPDDGDGSGGSKITLIGDCEFDDLTLTLGDDELHTDGHLLKAVDFTVHNAATLDWEDSLCVFSGHVDLNGNITTANSDTKIIHNTSAEKNWRSLYADAGVFFANGTQTTMTGYNWTSTGNEPTKVIAGSIFNTNSLKMNSTNLTIPYGGNFSGSTNIHSIAGDWTSSGGLIGKSALSFPDGGDSPTGAGNALDVPYDLVNLTGDATIEFWMKADANTNANSRGVINGYKASVANRWQLYQTTSNNLTFYSHDNNKSITVTCPTGKWSHVAIVCTGTGGDVKLYIDGKLEGQTELGSGVSLATSGAFPDFGVNRQDGSTDIRTGQSIFEGELAMLRIWTDERTQSELRDNMFATYANLTSNTDCAIAYEFDEGTSTDVDDKVGSNNGTLVNSVTWAGAGTFTQADSTVDLTGTGALTYQDNIDFNILKVAAATKTTTVSRLTAGVININKNLYVGDGTLTRSGAVTYRISNKTGVGTIDNSGTSISGASSPVDLSNTYVVYYHDSVLNKEVKFNFYINGSNTTFQANSEATEYWANAGYQTDVGDYNLKCKYMTFSDNVNGKFTMAAGDLWLTNAVNGLSQSYPSNTFTAGPGATISGSSAGTNFKSQNNFIVVGRVENLDVTNEELSVTGQVINCTGDIIQQHPTIDHDQQLDFDTADDRDVILGRDLDKNTELINS